MEYARIIDEALGSLGPLLRFMAESRFATRQGDPEICDFVFGNPHDGPLPEFTEALRERAVPQRKDWYAYTLNSPDAVGAVARALPDEIGLAVEEADIFLTAGTFAAIPVALRAIVDPGDEVVFVSPPWFFYESMIRFAGATPVRVSVTPPDFALDPAAIEAALTDRTRAVIVNSPHNPSGLIYGDETLAGLARVLAERSRRNGRTVWLLSDESYRRIRFDGRPFVSPAAHYDPTMVLYTYGKTLLSPGQRLGYIALPPAAPAREALRTAIPVAQMTAGWLYPSALMQHALPDLQDLSIDLERLQRRRDRMVPALRDMGYDVPLVPEGTFYFVVRSPVADDLRFSETLAERDVFVLPGAIFELPGWFRISLTANDEMIERSLPGFEAALKAAG